MFAVMLLAANVNPFIHPLLCVGYAAMLIVMGIVIAMLHRMNWLKELRRLQPSLLKRLNISMDRGDLHALHEARQRILALVPCVGRAIGSHSSRVGGRAKRLWLCFTRDQLIVIHLDIKKSAAFPLRTLKKLSLVESRVIRGYGLAIEMGGGTTVLEINRLVDMVRVVNVLKANGVVIGYMKI